MLQALLNSKHRLRYTTETNPFIEDSLTSCVFGLLGYLPGELLEEIWGKVLFDPEEQKSPGSLREFKFWPHWRSRENTASWREPDVFFRFDAVDVIVEAKRSDEERLQYAQQWRNELNAYREVFGRDKAPRVLLVVGGLGGTTKKAWKNETEQLEREFSCTIIFLSWSHLWLDCIKPALSKADIPQQVVRIREDLRRALRLFDIETEPPAPLETFPSLVFPESLHFSEAALHFRADWPALPMAQPNFMASFVAAAQKFQLKNIDGRMFQ